MRIDKRLKKIAENMAKMSLSKDGELLEKKVNEAVISLKSLGGSSAITALGWYLKMLKTEIGKHTLEIASAAPLSDSQTKEIVKNMKAKYKVTEVSTTLDEKLVGGIRVKIGDLVYDDSLGQKIASLREAII